MVMRCKSCYLAENFCREHQEYFNICLNCVEYGNPCLNHQENEDEGISLDYDFTEALGWLNENELYYFEYYVNKLFGEDYVL